jgi:hypothetical protein
MDDIIYEWEVVPNGDVENKYYVDKLSDEDVQHDLALVKRYTDEDTPSTIAEVMHEHTLEGFFCDGTPVPVDFRYELDEACAAEERKHFVYTNQNITLTVTVQPKDVIELNKLKDQDDSGFIAHILELVADKVKTIRPIPEPDEPCPEAEYYRKAEVWANR